MRHTLAVIPLLLAACGAPTVLLSGTVVADEDGQGNFRAIAGASVAITGAAQASLTTGLDGTFTIEVPRYSVPRLFIQADGHTGLFQSASVGESDFDQDYALYPVPLVDALVSSVGLVRDPAMGIVVVDFDTPSTLGGETATIDRPHEAVMTRDAEGAFILGDETPPGGDDTFISFLNVHPGAAIVQPRGPEGVRCRIDDGVAQWPVVENVVTVVRAACSN